LSLPNYTKYALLTCHQMTSLNPKIYSHMTQKKCILVSFQHIMVNMNRRGETVAIFVIILHLRNP